VSISRRKRAIRKAAGWARLAAWVGVLHLVHSPWEDLGGIVDETVRWSERFVLGSAAVLGWTLGGAALDRAGWPRRLTAPGLRRWMLYPVGAAVAVALPVLTMLAQAEIAGVVFNGLVAYVAGFDLAFDGWPLMSGREGGRSNPVYLDGPDEPVDLDDPDAADGEGGSETVAVPRRLPWT